MTPKPEFLTCCEPRWMAHRPGGGAWLHSPSCEAARYRVSNVVLSKELEDAIAYRRGYNDAHRDDDDDQRDEAVS